MTREEIYQLVWTMPLIEIAKKYQISDVGFHKLCKRLNIPVPGRGYWNKVNAGHKVRQTKLPKGTGTANLKERPPEQPVATVSELQALVKVIKKQPLPFKVPARLTEPDPLIAAARESLKSRTDTRYPGMMLTAPGEPDIQVSPGNAGRALRFMDAFIKCVRARGHVYQANYVLIRHIKLYVKFRERTQGQNQRQLLYPI